MSKETTYVECVLMTILERETQFMKNFDLCPPGKYFIKMWDVSYDTATEVNEEYFKKMINRSFEKDSPERVAAIWWNSHVIAHDSVLALSDGKHEIFIPRHPRKE